MIHMIDTPYIVIVDVDTIGESFGIDSKESALPHTGSQTLPTVATIQASLHMFISRQICFVTLGHFSMDN